MVDDGALADSIPHDKAVAAVRWRQTPCRQQPLGVVTHQERAVGPVADESFVVALLLQQHVDHGQSERAVAAWPNTQPAIRFAGQTMLPRIDDDHLGASGTGPGDPLGGGREGGERIGAPEQDAACILVIRRRRRDTERVLRAEQDIPGADMCRGQHVRTAERIGEPDQPRLEIRRRAARRCGAPEGDRLRAVLLPDGVEAGRGGVQSLFPRNSDPARIGIALGPCALHRVR